MMITIKIFITILCLINIKPTSQSIKKVQNISTHFYNIT